ncbi:hypothetical protein OSB04_002537 [Centaurea solstitialis]|uniref:Uncharacterized protein n=1 Tax=Centaurea solstitialis TaxID=347529 RepID=A0AA38WVC9_9ASTR|nr:hypothetical protein OSB04_002537 [Centaurea solstitialis]
MASTVTNTNNLPNRSILEKNKLTGPNFLDWERNLMIVLRHERKWYVLEEPLRESPPANAPAAAKNAHKKHSDDLLDVGCLMLATMSPDLQTGLINTNAYDMIRQLRDMFQTQARTERYDATKAFNECKMTKGTSVSDHVMKMKRHMDHLERLGHPVPLQLATDTILNSLSEDYKPFVINYNMNNMVKTIAELHSMLKTAELNMGAKNKTKDVLMVRDGGVKKKHGHGETNKGKGPVQAIQSAPKVRENIKGKGKGKKVKSNKARTENRCFTCNEVGHWRQNWPKRHEASFGGVGTEKYEKGGKAWKLDKVNSESFSRPRVIKSGTAKRATSRMFMLFTDFTSTLDIFAPRSRQRPSMDDSRTCLKRKYRHLRNGEGIQKKKQKEVKSQQCSTTSFEFRNGRRCTNVDCPEDRSDRTHQSDHEAKLRQGDPGKLLHMIKDLTFDGKNDSNPIVHLENFVDICDLFKTEENRDDTIRLRVFPLTLAEKQNLVTIFGTDYEPKSDPSDKMTRKTISESWERFKHLLNSCPSHGLSKSDQVQTFYSGLGYSSRATLDSSAGGVFMYKTPTEGYKLLEDMLIHNIDWRTDKRLQIPRMAGKISTDFDPSDELAAMKNQQVGCEECKGPHLTKDCPKRPMMTPEEVHYLNRGDYQGRWNNNRNFNPRPPGFFAPNQQNQRTEGEPRVSIEDRLIQFMDAQKKINDEVGRISQLLSERTQGELPTQTQVNPKVDNTKPMLMVAGATSKKTWTDIYTRKYVESDSGSEPDYAMDYDSEGFTISFEHLGLKGPIYLSDDEEEDGKQGGYAEFMIPKKDKGKEKEKEKVEEDELTYIAPIKHDPGSYSLPISSSEFKGLALLDTGAALNMMPVSYCRKFGIKKLPTSRRYGSQYSGELLHTAQVNVDICNQVSSLGYGDKRIYFNPDGEPVTHLNTPYEDPSQAYRKNIGRPLLPQEHMKKTEDYPNPIHQENKSPNESGPSKKEHRKKKGSSARRAKK